MEKRRVCGTDARRARAGSFAPAHIFRSGRSEGRRGVPRSAEKFGVGTGAAIVGKNFRNAQTLVEAGNVMPKAEHALDGELPAHVLIPGGRG